jgi:tetratricopeptide (TPR) repeat protein
MTLGDLMDRFLDDKHWYNRGVSFTESKEYEKALKAYDRALAYNEKDPDIWNNRCYVLTKLGKCDEAINDGNTAVELKPNDPELWDTLRNAYINCNNQEKADECHKNILRLKRKEIGSDPEFWVNADGKIDRSKYQFGADRYISLQIRIEDAEKGVDREIEVLHGETCPRCDGSGIMDTTIEEVLFLKTTKYTMCTTCGDTGRIPVKRTLSVHIPAGTKNGALLLIKGYGGVGVYDRDNGNLFITVEVL